MKLYKRLIFLIALILCCASCLLAQSNTDQQHTSLVTERLPSSVLKENRTGLDTIRTIRIVLPPGYSRSNKRYPVLYYLHNAWSNPDKLLKEGNLVELLEQGFNNDKVKEFIFVVADCSTAATGSLYENSPVSGRWLDFITQEVVPFIDKRYRTLSHRDSRGITGDFFGGRGTLQMAMQHSQLFSVAYAMHPVATGTGYSPLPYVQVDWKKIHEAKTYADLGDGRTPLFVTICQAFLPHPGRLPFHCDFFMEYENGTLKPHIENVRKGYLTGFLLLESLDEYAGNLRSLRGLALDWGRYDPVSTHVYSNQAFSRKLEDLGIEHEAEEYRGDHNNQLWTKDGRFYTRVLPFMDNHLVFEKQ